jgi:hypothetical protein
VAAGALVSAGAAMGAADAGAAFVDDASAGAGAGVWARESTGEAMRAKAMVQRIEEVDRLVIVLKVGDLLRF